MLWNCLNLDFTIRKYMTTTLEQKTDEKMSLNETEDHVRMYKNELYRRFERQDDCGKGTVEGERRCLHHLISPLKYNPQFHEYDIGSLKQAPQGVSLLMAK